MCIRDSVRSPALKLSFPGRHLIGVDVEVLGQLSYRPVALDGGKRHLCLESRVVDVYKRQLLRLGDLANRGCYEAQILSQQRKLNFVAWLVN